MLSELNVEPFNRQSGTAEGADFTDRRKWSLALLATPKWSKGGSDVERAAAAAP